MAVAQLLLSGKGDEAPELDFSMAAEILFLIETLEKQT